MRRLVYTQFQFAADAMSDQLSDDDELYEDSALGSNSSYQYYLYTFFATVAIGLPLLFLALFKIYVDHQRQQSERAAHEEKMREYQEAKKGLAASLRCEVSSTRARFERERMGKEAKEREARLDHGKQVLELESKIRSLERQLADKMEELHQSAAEAERTQQEKSAEHSQEMRKALNDIARLENESKRLEATLVRTEQEALEKCRSAEEKYRRERVTREEREWQLNQRIRRLGDDKQLLQTEMSGLKAELARAEERLRESQRSWRNMFSRSTTASGGEAARPGNQRSERVITPAATVQWETTDFID